MKKHSRIRIIIADDHEIFRDGLVFTIQDNPKYEVLASCVDGKQLIETTKKLLPDIVLTDLKMPTLSGVEAIQKIHKTRPEILCIALSTFDNEYMIVEALEAGAMGYITKSTPKKELFEAIESVHKNIPYYCKSTSKKLARMIGSSFFNPYSQGKKGLFNDIEKSIIRLICEDKSCKEIADILVMSIRTVENNRSKIFKKMNVQTTAGVAIYAVKHALYFYTE